MATSLFEIPEWLDYADFDNYPSEENPTTNADFISYARNQNKLVGALVAAVLWQPNTNFIAGKIIISPNMPEGMEAVALTGGVTGTAEPAWESGTEGYQDSGVKWCLRHKVATVNGLEPDDKGNIQIPVMTGSNGNTVGKDGLVPAPPVTEEEKFLSNDGTWKEAGKVKSVNGKTGNVIVDLPVGHMYWSVEPNVPAGRLPAMGATYNRALYADLWAWANSVGLVISESEWQAIASANDGCCEYYSSGDGSTTFRVPKLPNTIVTDASDGEVPVYGNGKTLGLTNGTNNGGMLGFLGGGHYNLSPNTSLVNADVSTSTSYSGDAMIGHIGVIEDATKSGIVAKTSATKITGQWLIVAFGIAHNIGEADVANVMQAVEQVQTSVGALEQGVGTAIDYIVESYRNGTEWYEVYKSGKVRQGGKTQVGANAELPVVLLKPYADAKYSVLGIGRDVGQLGYAMVVYSRTTTQFNAYFHGATTYIPVDWVAEGQGA